MSRASRIEIEAAIAALIDLLDAIDGEADLECGGDEEPSLGWTTTGGISLGGDDLETDEASIAA